MLELKNISKQYQGRMLADDLSLAVAPGETVALLGPSGSGKSTLLRIVAGLEAADAGSVWMDGQDITALPPERRGFALMFQDFALFPHLSALDNVPLASSSNACPGGVRASWRWKHSPDLAWQAMPRLEPGPCRAASSSASRWPVR